MTPPQLSSAQILTKGLLSLLFKMITSQPRFPKLWLSFLKFVINCPYTETSPTKSYNACLQKPHSQKRGKHSLAFILLTAFGYHQSVCYRFNLTKTFQTPLLQVSICPVNHNTNEKQQSVFIFKKHYLGGNTIIWFKSVTGETVS